jgi:hypothetical protein
MLSVLALITLTRAILAGCTRASPSGTNRGDNSGNLTIPSPRCAPCPTPRLRAARRDDRQPAPHPHHVTLSLFADACAQ